MKQVLAADMPLALPFFLKYSLLSMLCEASALFPVGPVIALSASKRTCAEV